MQLSYWHKLCSTCSFIGTLVGYLSLVPYAPFIPNHQRLYTRHASFWHSCKVHVFAIQAAKGYNQIVCRNSVALSMQAGCMSKSFVYHQPAQCTFFPTFLQNRFDKENLVDSLPQNLQHFQFFGFLHCNQDHYRGTRLQIEPDHSDKLLPHTPFFSLRITQTNAFILYPIIFPDAHLPSPQLESNLTLS